LKRVFTSIGCALVCASLATTGCARDCGKKEDFASSASSASTPSIAVASASAAGSTRALPDEAIGLSATDPVDVAAALIDLGGVEPAKLPLARARLWLLRRIEWGWSGLREHAAKIASEERRAIFWLKVEHRGDAVAILAAADGDLVTLKPESLDHVAKLLTRSTEEAARVAKVLGSDRARDTSFAGSFEREREVVNDQLLPPLWPDSKTLKEGELVRGSAFARFRVESTYYLEQSLVKDMDHAAQKLDRSRSNILQRSYLRARDRIQVATSRAAFPKTPSSRPKAVFLVLPSWMALEVERKAAELDCSRSQIVTATLAWGLPGLANEN
jgi:hypothetical protein